MQSIKFGKHYWTNANGTSESVLEKEMYIWVSLEMMADVMRTNHTYRGATYNANNVIQGQEPLGTP